MDIMIQGANSRAAADELVRDRKADGYPNIRVVGRTDSVDADPDLSGAKFVIVSTHAAILTPEFVD